MAYSAWAASTAYVVGDVVRATTVPATGLVFKCVDAGTSGGTEPQWPRLIAIFDTTSGTRVQGYVEDGGVVWAAITQFAADLQGVAPSGIIELFTLETFASLHGSASTYRFHAGANATATNGQVVFNGNSYLRYPVEATGFEYNGQGQLPRPTLRVANLVSTITAILQAVNTFNPGNDLLGAKVTRIRTLIKYLDAANFEGGTNPYGTPDPTAEFPRDEYYVARKSFENREVVEFELAAVFDLQNVRAPRRQVIANICPWTYRGDGCNYTGDGYFDRDDIAVTTLAADVCGKRLSSCKLRFDNGDFGTAFAKSPTPSYAVGDEVDYTKNEKGTIKINKPFTGGFSGGNGGSFANTSKVSGDERSASIIRQVALKAAVEYACAAGHDVNTSLIKYFIS